MYERSAVRRVTLQYIAIGQAYHLTSCKCLNGLVIRYLSRSDPCILHYIASPLWTMTSSIIVLHLSFDFLRQFLYFFNVSWLGAWSVLLGTPIAILCYWIIFKNFSHHSPRQWCAEASHHATCACASAAQLSAYYQITLINPFWLQTRSLANWTRFRRPSYRLTLRRLILLQIIYILIDTYLYKLFLL